MSKIIAASVLLFSCLTVIAADISGMSESDRKLAVGTLYLGQCVYLSKDFRQTSEVFNKNNIKEIRRNENELQYIDEWSMTKVTLRKDVCAIEIKSKELDKVAQSLPQVLQVAGGKLSLSKVAKGYWGKPGYRGELIKDGKPITVKVDIGPDQDDSIIVALFKK